MVTQCHKKIIKSRTPFANAIIAAYVIWIGDLICVLGDIYWLVAESLTETKPYHLVVGIILLIALLVILGSGTWLYISINLFLKKKEQTLWHSGKSVSFKATEESVDTNELDEDNKHVRLHFEIIN